MIKDRFKNIFGRKSRLIKKDYQKKEFVNPYFDKKRGEVQPNGFNTKFYLKILVVVLFFYLIIYSSLFKVEQINVFGLEMIGRQQFIDSVEDSLSSWRWYLLPQSNFILMSKSRLDQDLREKYDLDSLEIDKGWKTVDLYLKEKVCYLIVYNGQKFYFLDSEGVVNREVAQEDVENYWLTYPILNIGESAVEVGENITSEKIVSFVLELNEKIKNDYQLEIHGYELREGEEVALVAKLGWRAYFDINANIDTSLENLFLVLNEKVPDKNNLEYIDLRFGNKVFFK